MKLTESAENLGNSMEAAIKSMVDELFSVEIEDDQLEQILSDIKLSDLIVLDTAYTNGDKDKIKSMLSLDDLVEYSMGRTAATSQASSRPVPTRNAPSQTQQGQAASKNTTQTTRNYNSGNAVTTQTKNNNTDDQDDDTDQDVENSINTLQRNAGIK